MAAAVSVTGSTCRPTIGLERVDVTAARRDLEWYYWCAESEIGQRSALAAQIARLERGGAPSPFDDGDSLEERRRDALHRSRRIWRILRDVPAGDKDALDCTYTPRQWAGPLTSFFGDGVSIAMHGPLARAAYRDATDAKRARINSVAQWACDVITAGRAEDKLLLRAIRVDAEGRWLRAHIRYTEAAQACAGDLPLR